MSFKDKVVIVTGASSGIGACLAVEALKQGAKVTAVGRNQAKLGAMVKECEKQAGSKPLVVVADVSKEAEAVEIINKTIAEYGKIDVLVNNAGFGSRVGILDADAMKQFDEVMGTNTRAVVHLTHLVVPHLEKTKGNIVNISSVAALKAFPGGWAYCTAKAAMDHFSRCMAVELAPKGIRVNVINPGPVRTDFRVNMGLNEEQIQVQDTAVTDMTLLKRSSQPIEIVELILFLASDKAVGVTGSSFVSDNGITTK